MCPLWPGWPPGLRPVGGLGGSFGALGGLADGGSEELPECVLSRAFRSRTSARSSFTCACSSATNFSSC